METPGGPGPNKKRNQKKKRSKTSVMASVFAPTTRLPFTSSLSLSCPTFSLQVVSLYKLLICLPLLATTTTSIILPEEKSKP
jgi:hypothetical protein